MENRPAKPFPIYDAHNHLQDPRLDPCRESITEKLRSIGLARCVVNGTSEKDWDSVLALAAAHPSVVPSLGLHPWHVKARSKNWAEELEHRLNLHVAIGEIGLDKWIRDADLHVQIEVFRVQLQLAAKHAKPVTIHCLKAWGPLLETLREGPELPHGFLLHSYGGSAELIHPLAELGAYFSISGYFAHERKFRQREVFQQVPIDRLLIETDAPDMTGPDALNPFPLGGDVNNPANIVAVYEFASTLRRMPVPELASQVEANFKNLFGSVLG